MAAGIYKRHSKKCATVEGGRCNCQPGYQAHVFDARTGTRHRRHFRTEADAKAWRAQALVELRHGRLAQPRKVTLQQACDEYLRLAEQGVILTRGGDPYKPATLYAYRQTLRLRVYPRLGPARFDQIDLVNLQDLVDRMAADGWSPSTIVCALTPLKAVYGRALERREITIDPTIGVKLPRVRTRRDRIADPAEAERLLAVLDDRDRPIWATAMYAGLRRGELMALRVEDVDLDANLIHVRRSYDPRDHTFVATKNREQRNVPIPAALGVLLREQLLRTGRRRGLVFGESETLPFRPDRPRHRADKAWEQAKLARITLHECRHTYASLMIAAGVNAKALCSYMGHHSVTVTYDRYGHLMPGNEADAAGLLDAYLDAAKAASV
jgi:integrase